MTIAGFTSTGSKRPHALFGADAEGVPLRMASSDGATVRDTDGREYLDFIMGLGAVALGYGHPEVNRAATDAIAAGVTGPLSPADEEALAAELGAVMPWLEKVRFLKTGAEAVAAAIRIARVATGRDAVLGCGYHGWLDGCSRGEGVPVATSGLFDQIPFNDPEQATQRIRGAGDRLACVVIEPVIDAAPSSDWLAVLRTETRRVGAVLIFDEIKTAFRVAVGGAAEKWESLPDLSVLGKALANGFPLAVVGGRRDLMNCANRTWISSTAATELVSLAAARATLRVFRSESVTRHLAQSGQRLWMGLARLATEHASLGVRVSGIPQMCYLRHEDDALSARVAAECARRGLLFKRNAYNFVSLAHDDAMIDRALQVLAGVLAEC